MTQCGHSGLSKSRRLIREAQVQVDPGVREIPPMGGVRYSGSAKLTSGHSHNHGVLAYSKAAHKGGSFVIHGSLHFQMPKTACVRSSEKRFSVSTITSTSCISLFEPLQTYWPPPKTAYLAGKYRR
jgi:hypothetical protein